MIDIMKMWTLDFQENPLIVVFLLFWAIFNGAILSKIWSNYLSYLVGIIQIPFVWALDIWYFHEVKGYLTYDWDAAISYYTVPILWLILPILNGLLVWFKTRGKIGKDSFR